MCTATASVNFFIYIKEHDDDVYNDDVHDDDAAAAADG